MKLSEMDQRALFLIAGFFNTLFGLALFSLLVTFFGTRAPAVVSVVITWVASVAVAFVVHRKWVFQVSGYVYMDLARFAIANIVLLLVNLGVVAILVDHYRLPPIPVQIGMIVFILVSSYGTHKSFSFRRRGGSNDGGGDL